MTIDFMHDDVTTMNEQQLRDMVRALRGMVRITERNRELALDAAERANLYATQMGNLLRHIRLMTNEPQVVSALAPLTEEHNDSAGVMPSMVWHRNENGYDHDVMVFNFEEVAR